MTGGGCFFRQASTPNIDRIFGKNFSTEFCVVSNPTHSAESWASLLTGADPTIHTRTNENLQTEVYSNQDYPTVFKMIALQNNQAKLASYCEWSSINRGIIESGVAVDKQNIGGEDLKNKIIEKINSDMPELFFVQFDYVDYLGHTYGYGSTEQLAQITVYDGYIGEIYQALTDAGHQDDTLFIVTADHGGVGKNHGGNDDKEKYVFFGATGKYVPFSKNVLMTIRDIAGIIVYSLGYDGNAKWKMFDQDLLDRISKKNVSFLP